MLGALQRRITVRQPRRGRSGFAAPGLVDALVGGRDGAQQQRGQALGERVEQFAGGAVQRIAAPPLERVTGEHGPGLQTAPYARVLAVVRPVDGRGEPQGGGVLRSRRTGQLGHPCLQRVEHPVRRACHRLLSGSRVLHLFREPGEQGRHRGGRKQPPTPCRLGQLGHGETGYVAESRLGEERAVLTRHLRHDLVGHPVEDRDERRVVFLRGTQQMPRHRIRVPGGRGDHHPDVGRADQFGGEHPVVGH